MRAALLVLALLAAGCGPLTEVVVSIDGEPGFAARIELTVTNPDQNSPLAAYGPVSLPLCTDGPDCRSLPITATLIPGKRAPDERVRVQVDAYDGANVLLQ